MEIKWIKDYEFGIEKIDNQHIRLVGIINRLDEAYREKRDDSVIHTIFQSLRDYCNYHFSFEEMVMQKYKYSGYESHKSLHDEFNKKVKDYYFQYSGGDMLALKFTIEYLTSWLVSHILVEDRKYVPLLQSVINIQMRPGSSADQTSTGV